MGRILRVCPPSQADPGKPYLPALGLKLRSEVSIILYADKAVAFEL
jgi:hypothetical protein